MSRTERLAELLTTAELFKEFEANDRAECAINFHERQFAKGQMLFARGERGACLYVVEKGQIRLAIGASDGRELSFQIVGPGNIFGEIAVLDGEARSAEATALTATIVHSLDGAIFHRLLSARPGIAVVVVAYLCRRLREVSDKLEAIALYPLDLRLARFLLAALRGRSDIPGRRLPLEIPYSQNELALLLGASRPKINAALGVLESAGAIGRTADRLFCDRAKLMLIVEGDDPSPPSKKRPSGSQTRRVASAGAKERR